MAETETAGRSQEQESVHLYENTQEIEQRPHELAELESLSRATHEENVEISAERFAEGAGGAQAGCGYKTLQLEAVTERVGVRQRCRMGYRFLEFC